MAPRGLAGCRKTATGRDKKRDHPASPVIVFRQLSRRGVSPLGGPAAGGGRAGLFIPVPCGCNRLRYRLRSALSPRVGQTNPCIPQGYTARSHHPRAVEHRDCPPCGGGVCSMCRGVWVGDGAVRASTSGLRRMLCKRADLGSVIPQFAWWIPRNCRVHRRCTVPPPPVTALFPRETGEVDRRKAPRRWGRVGFTGRDRARMWP